MFNKLIRPWTSLYTTVGLLSIKYGVIPFCRFKKLVIETIFFQAHFIDLVKTPVTLPSLLISLRIKEAHSAPVAMFYGVAQI